MTIRCLIVDDEPLAIRVLEKYIAQTPGLILAGSCPDAFEARSRLNKGPVDLLFLDIHLPEWSGISFLRSLQWPPAVIFTTAYPEHAVEGFELEALDYLVKPISLERFVKAVNKAANRLRQAQAYRQSKEVAGPAYLLLRADRKLYKVDYCRIKYLKAYGDYVKVVTDDGPITPKTRLSDLEQQLPAERFARVHRSFIVALDRIRFMEGNHLHLDDLRIPIGLSYRDPLLRQLGTL